MTNTSIRPLRKVLGILTGVSLGISGLCLAVSCLGIYRGGEFTPELVAAAFRPISLPVFLSLALVALGLILELCFPGSAEKPRAFQTNSQILTRLGSRADFSAWDDAHIQELTDLEKKRIRTAAIRNLVFLFCGVLFLVYALNGANFDSSRINQSMIRAMWVLLPCLAVSCAAAVWAHFYMEKNRLQCIALLKQAPTRPKTAAATPVNHRLPVKAILVGLAAAMILFGFFTGGTADVLTKAVNICTECVGLG